MTTFRHFEDFHAGEVIDLGRKTVSRAEIIEFASEFDAQPFHLDEEAARKTLLGGLAASGWHSCAIFMRLLVDNLLAHSSSEGAPGVEKLKWLRPVRPDDTLSLSATVTEVKPSSSRPTRGSVHFAFTLTNQHGEPVMTLGNWIMFGRKGAAA
ncbi:MAG TPA: MaoC family dehydratase [Hyphomicrobiales bacterium]|nr:MaoC family dehydratase [Hyphomicrobiales bacterium]